jgi:hypothetical protein
MKRPSSLVTVTEYLKKFFLSHLKYNGFLCSNRPISNTGHDKFFLRLGNRPKILKPETFLPSGYVSDPYGLVCIC